MKKHYGCCRCARVQAKYEEVLFMYYSLLHRYVPLQMGFRDRVKVFMGWRVRVFRDGCFTVGYSERELKETPLCHFHAKRDWRFLLLKDCKKCGREDATSRD